MGACSFVTESNGKTAKEAFSMAVSQAQYESGHGGYTGTIAEKRNFTIIRDTAGSIIKRLSTEQLERKRWTGETLNVALKSPDRRVCGMAIAEALMNELEDSRVRDKWGAAGCIDLGDGKWVFFGYASS